MVGTSISKNLGVNKLRETYGQRYYVINPSPIQIVKSIRTSEASEHRKNVSSLFIIRVHLFRN